MFLLWGCNTIDLSDVGYGESDRLKASDVKEVLYNASEGCWMTECEGREFFFQFSKDGTPIHKPIVEPWKCPYHNGRMCMEVIRRMNDAS